MVPGRGDGPPRHRHSIPQGNWHRSLPRARGRCAPPCLHLPWRWRWLCWGPRSSADRPPPPVKPGTSWDERCMFPPQHRPTLVWGQCDPSRRHLWGGQLCQTVPAGAQRCPLLLAEYETLVVGRHVHLQAQRRGSGGPRQCGALPPRGPPHPPSSPGAARWPRPAAAAAPCPASPRRDFCGVRQTDISSLHSPKQHPHLPGLPRVGGVSPQLPLWVLS